MLVMRSNNVSGRATSPTALMVSSVISRSARMGGNAMAMRSAMSGSSCQGSFDPVGEQQIVNALFQCLEIRAAAVAEFEMMRVELGFHAAGMRRENKDAAAD